MYKTLNFGPGPVLNPATTDWVVNFTGIEPGSALAVFPKVPVAVPYSLAGSVRLVENGDLTLTDGTHISFGLPIQGDHIDRENLLVQVAMACSVQGTSAVLIKPFIARSNSATLTTGTGASVNQCDNPDWLPAFTAYGTDIVECCYTGKPLVGPLDDSTVPSDNPLIVGFRISNRSGANVTFEIEAGISAFRNRGILQSSEDDR